MVCGNPITCTLCQWQDQLHTPACVHHMSIVPLWYMNFGEAITCGYVISMATPQPGLSTGNTSLCQLPAGNISCGVASETHTNCCCQSTTPVVVLPVTITTGDSFTRLHITQGNNALVLPVTPTNDTVDTQQACGACRQCGASMSLQPTCLDWDGLKVLMSSVKCAKLIHHTSHIILD